MGIHQNEALPTRQEDVHQQRGTNTCCASNRQKWQAPTVGYKIGIIHQEQAKPMNQENMEVAPTKQF
jgi:hypothetical protein